MCVCKQGPEGFGPGPEYGPGPDGPQGRLPLLRGGAELPADARRSLYVESVPRDASRREIAHIFRPFPGYKVPLCPCCCSGRTVPCCADSCFHQVAVANTLFVWHAVAHQFVLVYRILVYGTVHRSASMLWR